MRRFRAGEPIERRQEGGVVEPADSAQQRIGEVSSQHGADLRDLARLAQPVEPRRERLRRRRDRLQAAGLASLLSRSRVTSSTNSGTPPVRSLTPSTTSWLSAWRAASCHLRHVGAIEGAERDDAVMKNGRFQGGRNSGRVVAMMKSGAVRPRSARACRRSSGVGSAQCRSSNASTAGCVRAPARNQAISAASCLRLSSSGGRLAARPGGKGMSTRGATSNACSVGSRPISCNVLKVGETLTSGGVGIAKTLAAPFGDQVQRRILQQL